MADPFQNYANGIRGADWGAAAAAFNAAKDRASANYASVGFGPTVTAKFQRKLAQAQYRAPNVDRAVRNYTEKMRS